MAYYYPKTLYRIQVAMLDRFNDIVVKRYSKNGSVVETIDVPIFDWPRRKTDLSRNKTKTSYESLPKISVKFAGISYDSARQTNPSAERFWLDDAFNLDVNNTLKRDFEPTPYNFDYTVSIHTNSMSDFAQILEQILPYFTPNSFLEINEFTFLNIRRSIQMELVGISPDLPDEYSDDSNSHANVELSFTLKGYMYKPVETTSLIEKIDSKYFINGEFEDIEYENGDVVTSAMGTTLGEEFLNKGYVHVSAIPVSASELSGSIPATDYYYTEEEV
jgi:hypothetical protein